MWNCCEGLPFLYFFFWEQRKQDPPNKPLMFFGQFYPSHMKETGFWSRLGSTSPSSIGSSRIFSFDGFGEIVFLQMSLPKRGRVENPKSSVEFHKGCHIGEIKGLTRPRYYSHINIHQYSYRPPPNRESHPQSYSPHPTSPSQSHPWPNFPQLAIDSR